MEPGKVIITFDQTSEVTRSEESALSNKLAVNLAAQDAV